MRVLGNAVKRWLIAYHECVTVRILRVAHRVEILEIQAIARFKSGRPHQHTHTHLHERRRTTVEFTTLAPRDPHIQIQSNNN